MTNWVTVDKFSEHTGISRDFALRHCRSGNWQEHVAWRKLSDKVYLISMVWWDKWHEAEAASKLRQKAALKSSSNISESDAENESNASPRLPTFDA